MGFGGLYGSIDESEVSALVNCLENSYHSCIYPFQAVEAVRMGLKLGLNYIDTSPWYGDTKSESLLGKVRNNLV